MRLCVSTPDGDQNLRSVRLHRRPGISAVWIQHRCHQCTSEGTEIGDRKHTTHKKVAEKYHPTDQNKQNKSPDTGANLQESADFTLQMVFNREETIPGTRYF